MRRRDIFRIAGGGLILGSAGALAQRTWRVSIITPSQGQWQPRTFREALAASNFREDANLKIEVASAEGELGRLPVLAEEVVATKPDVIVAVNTPGIRAAMAATSSIPIVAAAVADPVFLGIVRNLVKPERNVTGVANLASDFTSKRILLLKEVIPNARRIALLAHPDEPISELQIKDAERNAEAIQIEARAFFMRTDADLESSMVAAVNWGAQAVVRLAGQGLALGAETGRMATKAGLPSMLLQRRDVEAGGLMSYFTDQREVWRSVAAQVSRLLKGNQVSDLPFELPTRFELVVSLTTGKALGLTIPPSLIARADEVIE